MDVFLPEGFRPGLSRSRAGQMSGTVKASVVAGGVRYPVLRRWACGFAVSDIDVPKLQGVVDIYDGPTHLGQCLIKSSRIVGEGRIYEITQAAVLNYAAVAESDFDDGCSKF